MLLSSVIRCAGWGCFDVEGLDFELSDCVTCGLDAGGTMAMFVNTDALGVPRGRMVRMIILPDARIGSDLPARISLISLCRLDRPDAWISPDFSL